MINFKKISLAIAMAGLLVCSALQAMDDHNTLLASNQIFLNEMLGMAIQSGNKDQEDQIKKYVKIGADVNSECVINNRSQTPLVAAILNQNPDIIKYLVEKASARVDLAPQIDNFLLFTPVHYAAMIRNLDILKLVLSGRVNGGVSAVNLTDKCGNTPLHLAVRQGNVENAQLLIERGADVNAKGNCGNTPLFEAVVNEHIRLIELLSDKGAKVTSGLASACRAGQDKVVAVLLKNHEITLTDISKSSEQLNEFIRSIFDKIDQTNKEKIMKITEMLERKKAELEERCNNAGTMLVVKPGIPEIQ